MAQQIINVDVPNSGNGDTLRTSQVKANSNFTELYSNKVDKVVGKGLSDTNFTQAEKDKLAGIPEGGQVQSDWDEGNASNPAFIKNKPTNTSDFTNDGDGTQAYVPDAATAGLYVRQPSGWVNAREAMQPKIMDGIIGVTVGFIVGQTVFSLPSGSKCVGVYLAHQKQYMTTANNTSLVNRWSQTGDDITITKSPVLNNYIYIEYI